MTARPPTDPRGWRRPAGQGPGFDRSIFIRPVAHRGLHDRRQGIIENTAPAFQAAIENDYGIECDLQPASDGTPMVFHDASLDRLMQATGRIAAHSPEELSRLRYKETNDRILTFQDLLALIDTRVPLLAEVKSDGRPPAGFLQAIASTAAAYRGPIALMSFDGTFVSEIGKLAGTVPRGLVAGTHQLAANWWAGPSEAGQNAAVAALLEKAPPGISFLAVEVKMLEAARVWIDRNTPHLALFTWTVRTAKDRAAAARWADAPIFEEPGPAEAKAGA